MTTEDVMLVWHHQLNGHGFEKTQGNGDGQESLACCSPWVTELDTTEQQNNNVCVCVCVCVCLCHIFFLCLLIDTWFTCITLLL